MRSSATTKQKVSKGENATSPPRFSGGATKANSVSGRSSRSDRSSSRSICKKTLDARQEVLCNLRATVAAAHESPPERPIHLPTPIGVVRHPGFHSQPLLGPNNGIGRTLQPFLRQFSSSSPVPTCHLPLWTVTLSCCSPVLDVFWSVRRSSPNNLNLLDFLGLSGGLDPVSGPTAPRTRPNRWKQRECADQLAQDWPHSQALPAPELGNRSGGAMRHARHQDR